MWKYGYQTANEVFEDRMISELNTYTCSKNTTNRGFSLLFLPYYVYEKNYKIIYFKTVRTGLRRL